MEIFGRLSIMFLFMLTVMTLTALVTNAYREKSETKSFAFQPQKEVANGEDIV